MPTSIVNVTIQTSEDEKTATVRLGTKREPIVCGLLGKEITSEGKIKYYFDCLLHNSSKDVVYSGYRLSGAISTIATQIN